MRLTERVHLVGSGRYGLTLSDDFDGNAYVIDGGSELALVDAGAGVRQDALVGLVAAAGFDPGRVSTVLLTHKHADHAGGAGGFARSTGARVTGSAATATALADPDAVNRGLERARRVGAYPAEYRFTGIDDVTVVGNGDVLRIGDLEVRVVDTAGHCDGHLAFAVGEGHRTHAFTGDALLPGGEIVIQPIADLSLPASITAIERLAGLGFDGLMPGHGAPALRGGVRHAHLALLAVARGGMPPAFRTPPFAALEEGRG